MIRKFSLLIQAFLIFSAIIISFQSALSQATDPGLQKPVAGEAALGNQIFLPFTVADHPAVNIMGVEMRPIHTEAGFDAMADAGSGWVRRNGLVWKEVETVKDVRNWDPVLENELLLAAQKGMQTILIVRGAPDWARKDTSSPCGPIKEWTRLMKHFPQFSGLLL